MATALEISYFETSSAVFSTLGLLNVLVGLMIAGIIKGFPFVLLVSIVVSAMCALANGISYYVFNTNAPDLNKAIACVFMVLFWMIQEVGLPFYGYAILIYSLHGRERRIFLILFWSLIFVAVAFGITILVLSVRRYFINILPSQFSALVGPLHIGYFVPITLAECLNAVFLLRKFRAVLLGAVLVGRSKLYHYIIRSTEIRVTSLALIGISRTKTYSTHTIGQNGNVGYQFDKFVYMLECFFPIIMFIDILAARLVFADDCSTRSNDLGATVIEKATPHGSPCRTSTVALMSPARTCTTLANCPETEDHLEKLLESLPRTLNETYERMLSNIPSESFHDARRMLTMLCCSRRPLTVAELTEGVAVELGDIPKFNPKRQLKGIYAIEEICPGFTEVDTRFDTKETTVRIAHFSVQEYLESKSIRESKDVAIYSVTKERANAEMARICLAILLDPDLINPEPTGEDWLPSQKLCPKVAIADYAARYWPAHYMDCQTNPLVDALAYRLFDKPDGPFKTWTSIWNVDGHHWKVVGKPPAPLYYASLLGLDVIVRRILASYAESVRVSRLKVLHRLLAVFKDSNQKSSKIEVKDDRAVVNERGGYYGTALQAASAGGHDDVVCQLLEKGAELDADGGFYGSALHAAAHNGNEATVRKLLEQGVGLSAGHERNASVPVHVARLFFMVMVLGYSVCTLTLKQLGRPLLCETTSCGLLCASVVGFLASTAYSLIVFGWPPRSWIECRGLFHKTAVDVDLKDKDGRTPLSLAAEIGHGNVTEVLLEKGSEVDSQDAYGRTALSYAAEYGHDNVTKQLLENGATANTIAGSQDSEIVVGVRTPTEIGDAENMTPLHYTVRFSAIKVAKLLLQSGMSPDVAVHRRVWEHSFDRAGDRRICEQRDSQNSFKTGVGLTPLHYAAWVGNEVMVSFFLHHGADPNALSDFGETPLHLAVAKKIKGPQYNIYRDYWTEDDWKIEVTISHAISEGDEAEYRAARDDVLLTRIKVLNSLLGDVRTETSIEDNEGESALHKVQYSTYGSSYFVKKLLQKNAKYSSRIRDKMTPLHLACRYSDTQSVRLLATSADYLTACDSRGENALHLACTSGCVKTMAEVIQACEKNSVDLSATRNKSGRNALHCYAASIIVSVKGVQLLLEYGVSPSEIDADGASPISIYRDQSLGSVEPEVCKLLGK